MSISRHDETIRPHTRVGLVEVGGLTPAQAEARLRAWWEQEKVKPISLSAPSLKKALPDMLPEALGVSLDPAATIADLPRQTLTGELRSNVDPSAFPQLDFPLKYHATGAKPKALIAKIAEQVGTASPARVDWVKGAIMLKPEGTSIKLDEPNLVPAVIAALQDGKPAEVPLVTAEKKVPDAELAKMRYLVTQFSTRFAARNYSRCTNIKLAASFIDGKILMPGEKFSFNETVGRRTKKAGFQEAGVYINGRHDTGIGGGICQVSSTLYNAALLANFPIKRRSNHSLPVPYVPLGQDATVDYGNLDLVFENNYKVPIGIDAEYLPGKLTFRLVGEPMPGLKVKVVQGESTTKPFVVQRVNDPNLAPGKIKVIEPGSIRRIVKTYRLVYVDGKLKRRQQLGRSTYGGTPRIIAVSSSVSNPAQGNAPGRVESAKPTASALRPVSQPVTGLPRN